MEKTETKKRSYSINWAVGDTFAHQLTHPAAEKAGIHGWYLIFRKVGQYVNSKGQIIQLGYLTLCPSAELPQTAAELNALGYLRMMNHGEKWDYMVQVDVQSKRAENKLGMKWVGCFPDAASPKDETEICPVGSMPLFGGIDKNTSCPRYEDAVCRFYRWYGIGGV